MNSEHVARGLDALLANALPRLSATLRQYEEVAQKSLKPDQTHVLSEVGRRIRQVHYGLLRLSEAEANFHDVSSRFQATLRENLDVNAFRFLASEQDQIIEIIQFYSEAFYGIAHRATGMLNAESSQSAGGLPGMPAIDIRGVTMVRNWLVEHPGQIESAFAYGGEFAGPALNGGCGLDNKGAPVFDLGLHANAEEWCEKLTTALLTARDRALWQLPKRA